MTITMDLKANIKLSKYFFIQNSQKITIKQNLQNKKQKKITIY